MIRAIQNRYFSFCHVMPRISSLDQKPANGKMPERLRLPITNVQNVIGIDLRRPPMRRISNVFVAWFTEPEPRKSSDLKNACVIRWKIAAT